jgi:hypothetical protein
MKKEPTLKEKIWTCARKYAYETGKIIGMEPQFWVAEDISITTCCFGDVEFLNLDEMMVIVDHIDRWVEKYGSREKVGEVVCEWIHWCLNDAYDAEKDEWQSHPRINLWSWLKGMRPEMLKRNFYSTFASSPCVVDKGGDTHAGGSPS